MWFPIFNQSLHQMLIKWIGKAACDGGAYAGIGTACKGAEALNMGIVVLAVLALVLAAAWLNARRSRRRSAYSW